MKHAIGEKEHLLDVQLSAPVKPELTPRQEIELLKAEIVKEQGKLDAFASNARVCAVFQARIHLLETEVAKWIGVIYAAGHEAHVIGMRRLMDAVVNYDGEE